MYLNQEEAIEEYPTARIISLSLASRFSRAVIHIHSHPRSSNYDTEGRHCTENQSRRRELPMVGIVRSDRRNDSELDSERQILTGNLRCTHDLHLEYTDVSEVDVC